MTLDRDREARADQGADQTLADLDQTQSDTDQTAADADQQVSETEQGLADRDRQASHQDQDTSDRDQAVADAYGTTDPDEADWFKRSRAERRATTREREDTAAARSRTTAMRLRTAARRDEVARARDLAAAARDRSAQARDESAEARDRAADARELHAMGNGEPDEALAALRALRLAAAAARRQAALERVTAARDREAAAADRQTAAVDRGNAALDELTGVFRRGTGELALTHEIERARRSGRPSVVIIIDADALKSVNDRHGHAAGDAMLRDVAAAITSSMRSYDVAVRWGGDEFVCALSDINVEIACDRVDEIKRALHARRPGASISVGIAETDGRESLEAVVARADAALYRAKSDRHSS
jgi:diguanylate cyclase (GGDEF)-like protein